jgi:hypothetical protein
MMQALPSSQPEYPRFDMPPAAAAPLLTGIYSREAACAFIHDRSLHVPGTAPAVPSLPSPPRRSPVKFLSSSSPLAHNSLASPQRMPAHQPLCSCHVSFVPGRQTAAQFGTTVAGKSWTRLPVEGEQAQQTRHVAQAFASLIGACTNSISMIIGANTAGPMDGAVLKAAAVDLFHLKTMCVAASRSLATARLTLLSLQVRITGASSVAVQKRRRQHLHRQDRRSRGGGGAHTVCQWCKRQRERLHRRGVGYADACCRPQRGRVCAPWPARAGTQCAAARVHAATAAAAAGAAELYATVSRVAEARAGVRLCGSQRDVWRQSRAAHVAGVAGGVCLCRRRSVPGDLGVGGAIGGRAAAVKAG